MTAARIAERRARLMPGGVPKKVRCYDDGGEGDRYTVVFTGRVYMYLAMNAHPFHPQGIGQHGEWSRWDGPIDRPTYKHLGKKIAFAALPADCQRLVIRDYEEIYELTPRAAKEAAERRTMLRKQRLAGDS